jgi:hypothetical protein
VSDGDHHLKEISPDFRDWWPRHDVQGVHTGKQELNHPIMGRLVMQATALQVIDHPDLRMVIYTPLAEGDTASKLVVLAGIAPAAAVTGKSEDVLAAHRVPV